MATIWRGIETLFGSDRGLSFLSDIWPERLHVERGSLERLAPLVDVPELVDLDALFAAPGATSSAIDRRQRTDFIQRSALGEPKLTRELFEAGHTILMGDLHLAVPALGDMLALLVRQLGLPQEGPLAQARITAYVSPPGEALAPHFDRNVNFVVQLQGRKRWRISRAPAAESVTTVYYPSVPERSYDELWRYADAEVLATGMPDDCIELELEPGSVMYMPRGLWHATEAPEFSWSLNFVINQPTWLDVVERAIHDHLVADPRWRALASTRDRQTVAELLARLPEQLGMLTPDAVIAHANDVALYHPVPDATLSLSGDVVRISSPELPDFEARVAAEQVELLRWLGDRRAPFWAREAYARAPAVEHDAIDRLLMLFVRHGLLRRRGFDVRDGQLLRIV